MATTLPRLVAAIAESDGRKRQTLEHFARTYRESGELPTTKRGGGASKLGLTEAVKFLLRTNVADSPETAPVDVLRYQLLETNENIVEQRLASIGVETIRLERPERPALPAPWNKIDGVKGFGKALETCVTIAPDIERALRELVVEKLKPLCLEKTKASIDYHLLTELAGIHIELFKPFPFAVITVFADHVPEIAGPPKPKFRWRYFAAAHGDPHRPLYEGIDPVCDRRVTIRFGLRTLLAIHNALHEPE